MEDRQHSFSVGEAKKHGVEKAILLNNLRFWLDKNMANGKNIHAHTDGREYYWTYNKATAFAELFPYMNYKSIGRWLRELEESGEIISGCFNENKYDKTKWYSTFSHSVAHFEQPCAQDEQPSYTDVKTHISCTSGKPDQIEASKTGPDLLDEKNFGFTRFWSAYPKKELKKKALGIWTRRKLDSELDSILLFISKAIESKRWKDGYIKQPTAFLNGDCWNDDLAAYGPVGAVKPGEYRKGVW